MVLRIKKVLLRKLFWTFASCSKGKYKSCPAGIQALQRNSSSLWHSCCVNSLWQVSTHSWWKWEEWEHRSPGNSCCCALRAASLPCQQKLLSEHCPYSSSHATVWSCIHGAASISTCVWCAEGSSLKPVWSLVWQRMEFSPHHPFNTCAWFWWSSAAQVTLCWTLSSCGQATSWSPVLLPKQGMAWIQSVCVHLGTCMQVPKSEPLISWSLQHQGRQAGTSMDGSVLGALCVSPHQLHGNLRRLWF